MVFKNPLLQDQKAPSQQVGNERQLETVMSMLLLTELKRKHTEVKAGTDYAGGVQSCCDSTRKARASLELNLETFLHVKGSKRGFYV